MEIVVQILKHLPAGWPRILAVMLLGIMFFFPEMRRRLTKSHREKEQLELAKQLLELRQLELTVAGLKSKTPESKNIKLDSQIEKIFSEPGLLSESDSDAEMTGTIEWVSRLKFSMIGSFTLMILGSIALWHSGRFIGENAPEVILFELSLAVVCGFIAALVPSRSRWESVFRGFLIPAVIGALAVAAKGNMD